MNSTEQRKREWPVLRSAQEVTCGGLNPRDDLPCVLGQHQGPHRDDAGGTWPAGVDAQ